MTDALLDQPTGDPAGHGERPRLGSLRRSLTTAAAGGAALLALAGCSAAAPATGGSSGTTATGILSDASIATIATYTGSTPGKADSSLTPVTWGFVNQEGGAVTFPAYTRLASTLVDVVNDQLGGIGGHPLELDVCHVVSSDEEGQACGQRFANNKAISAILEYPLITGGAAFHRVVDPTGIPIFGPSANSIDDAKAPNGFFATGPNFSDAGVTSQYIAQTLKAKSVAILGVQGSALTQIIDAQLTAALTAAGVTTKLATVSPTSTDVTAPLIAAGVKDADVIVATLPAPPLCASVAKALDTLGAASKPVVGTVICASDDTKAILGDYPKWTYVGGYPDQRAPALNERETSEIAVQKDLFTAAGSVKGDQDFTAPTLQGLLTALAVVQDAGGTSATPATTTTAARAFTGPLFLGQDTVAWGKNPALPAVGTLAERVYSYTGGGTWVDSGKGWVTPAVMAPPS